jgi:HSP20 family protein
MNVLTEWKHGLENAFGSLSEGWGELRERAAGALTRFKPGRSGRGGELERRRGDDDELPFTDRWGVMAADLYDSGDKVVVRIEAPGMRRDDFDIELHPGLLVVQGEKRYERESKSGSVQLMQCAYGHFRRAVALPDGVKGDKAAATYRDGVLRIELPKEGGSRARRIEVRER